MPGDPSAPNSGDGDASEKSGDCFYCGLETDEAHPECDRPGCDNQTHGRGADGKRVLSYCPNCRDNPLVTDGGLDTERPAFIDPQTEWVECYLCGRRIEDMSRVEGMDISTDDEYYPKMVPVCRDGNHRDAKADGGLDAPTPEEHERRARQSGIGFVVRCRRAGVDPHETLDDVLDDLDDVGPDDDDDPEPKAVLPDGGTEESVTLTMAAPDASAEALAADLSVEPDGVRMKIDLARRVQTAVNEDDVDVREAQAAVESLASELQEPAGVPDDWILEERFGVVRAEDVEDRSLVGRLRWWWPW